MSVAPAASQIRVPAGNPITYQIGQDVGHNGFAIFNANKSSWLYLDSNSNLIISGDTGDGQQHFQIVSGSCGGYGCVDGNTGRSSNVRISYIEFNTQGAMAYFWNNGGNFATGIEWDHNDMNETSDADHALFWVLTGSGYGANSIHDNVFTGLVTSGGFGADAVQGGSGYTDMYNNTITMTVGSYTGTQHNDGYQVISKVQYIRIWNNHFTNIGNYPVYIEGSASGSNGSNIMIYNNIMDTTNSGMQSSSTRQAVAIGPHVGGLSWTNVLVANNDIVDYGPSSCIDVRDPGPYSPPVTWTNVRVYNNICWNGAGNVIDSGVITGNNITSNNGSHFASYINLSPSNNMRLLSTDTLFRDKGTTLSDFSIDKDGVTRPQGPAWDIGAYEYSGQGAELPAPPQFLTVK